VKLSDLQRVRDIADVREYLMRLKNEGTIEISIDGHFQNREFVEHVATSVRLELRHQIREYDEQLMDLGVVIDC